MNYDQEVIISLLTKGDKSKKVNNKLVAFFSFLLNHSNIVKNISAENLTPDYIIETIEDMHNITLTNKEVLTNITNLIKLNYITCHPLEDTVNIILTKEFYDYYIDNYDVEEELLPLEYGNISEVIIEKNAKYNKVTVNTPIKQKEFDYVNYFRMTDAKIKKDKAESDKKRKELNNYICNLYKKNFYKN